MKPISEYNFREIMDNFVILDTSDYQNSFLEYKTYIAYCYIDIEKGVSFSLYGRYEDGNIFEMKDHIVTLRYSEKLNLEIYNSLDEKMVQYAARMKELYTMPDWIDDVRKDARYDRYRDKAFPDDMLLSIRTPKNNTDNNFDQIEEALWVRPISMLDNGELIGITIEDGKYIEKNSMVWIWENVDENHSIVGVTTDWINMLNQYSKGDINV